MGCSATQFQFCRLQSKRLKLGKSKENLLAFRYNMLPEGIKGPT